MLANRRKDRHQLSSQLWTKNWRLSKLNIPAWRARVHLSLPLSVIFSWINSREILQLRSCGFGRSMVLLSNGGNDFFWNWEVVEREQKLFRLRCCLSIFRGVLHGVKQRCGMQDDEEFCLGSLLAYYLTYTLGPCRIWLSLITMLEKLLS